MKSQVQAFKSSLLFKNKGSNTFCICIKFPHVNIDKKQDQRSKAPTWYQLGPLSHLGHFGSHLGII